MTVIAAWSLMQAARSTDQKSNGGKKNGEG